MSGPPSWSQRAVSAPQAICEVLEQAGIDTVVGIPGGDVMKIFDALYDHRDTICTMLVREESLAAIMAEVYGRITGRPAVVLAQGAWVLANAAMGTLEALTGGSPMVILTDLSDKTPFSHHSPTQTGTGDYGTWDAHLAFRGFMKEVMEARDPAQAVQLTQLAIKHATAGCPGPVAVVYYRHALAGEVGPAARPALHHTGGYLVGDHRQPDAESLSRAVSLLDGAAKPVIIAGNGVRVGQATDALARFAEKRGCPVVTTSSGKGVFPEIHELAGGVVGEYGLRAAAHLVGESDVVLAVGTRLAPGDTLRQHPAVLNPTRQEIIQIDVEPRHVGWTHPVTCGLLGDAAATLNALARHISTADGQLGAARVRAAAALGSFDTSESVSGDVPILPQRVIRDLYDWLPSDAVVTADAGENRIFLTHHYRTRAAGGFLQPGSMGGMGYAIPAALGAKLAHPDRPVVAVAGDGGFAMTMNGLLTSLEIGAPITVVVLNNAMLGWVRHIQGPRPIASTLGSVDHAAIARAMGCDARRIEQPDDFGPALAAAVSSGRTTVLDVITSPGESWEKVVCSVGG